MNPQDARLPHCTERYPFIDETGGVADALPTAESTVASSMLALPSPSQRQWSSQAAWAKRYPAWWTERAEAESAQPKTPVAPKLAYCDPPAAGAVPQHGWPAPAPARPAPAQDMARCRPRPDAPCRARAAQEAGVLSAQYRAQRQRERDAKARDAEYERNTEARALSKGLDPAQHATTPGVKDSAVHAATKSGMRPLPRYLRHVKSKLAPQIREARAAAAASGSSGRSSASLPSTPQQARRVPTFRAAPRMCSSVSSGKSRASSSLGSAPRSAVAWEVPAKARHQHSGADSRHAQVFAELAAGPSSSDRTDATEGSEALAAASRFMQGDIAAMFASPTPQQRSSSSSSSSERVQHVPETAGTAARMADVSTPSTMGWASEASAECSPAEPAAAGAGSAVRHMASTDLFESPGRAGEEDGEALAAGSPNGQITELLRAINQAVQSPITPTGDTDNTPEQTPVVLVDDAPGLAPEEREQAGSPLWTAGPQQPASAAAAAASTPVQLLAPSPGADTSGTVDEDDAKVQARVDALAAQGQQPVGLVQVDDSAEFIDLSSAESGSEGDGEAGLASPGGLAFGGAGMSP